MPQENVEVVRTLFTAWNQGDMAALREVYDPDVVVRAPEGWPEPGPFVGREAVLRQWEQQRDAWDADAIEQIGDMIDTGDRIISRFVWHAAGRGPEAGFELTAIYTLRNRRIMLTEFFWNHGDALDAVGLRE